MGILRYYTRKQYIEHFKQGFEELKQKTQERLNEKWFLDPSYNYTVDKLYKPIHLRRLYHFTPPQLYREIIAIKHYASVNKFDIRWVI